MNLESTSEDCQAAPNLDNSLRIDGDNGEEIGLEDVDVSEAMVGPQGKGKRRRKHTSTVWSFFEAFCGQDGKKRAKCKACAQVYIAEGSYGTGNMKRHIPKCPRLDTRDIGQMIINDENGQMGLAASKFDPDIFRELWTAAIIMHDLPFQFVEYEGIRTALSYARSEIKPMSRNTCKSDILKMHSKEKVKVKSLLESIPSRISLTSDLWSSITTDGYI